jgi:hypothetical protein
MDQRVIDSTQHLARLLIADEVVKNFSHLINSKGCRRSSEDGQCKRTTRDGIPW